MNKSRMDHSERDPLHEVCSRANTSHMLTVKMKQENRQTEEETNTKIKMEDTFFLNN